MNKKLGRLIQPGMGSYFLVMGLFCLAALASGQLVLAAVECVITAGMTAMYAMRRKQRCQLLHRYLQQQENTLESVGGGETPFPSVMVRLGDGAVTWANKQFLSITGYSDLMRVKSIQELVPGFTVDWLAMGKNESPYDVTIGKRRYRIYGTTMRADDSAGTMLGVFYFADLTMLYQIRDEYVRSRPVVSIILIDNYDELTKNLNESAISNLNARINDSISAWTESFHGMIRRLDRSRYLFVFERKDLERAKENKFSLLEDVHQIVSPSGLPASISIGLGVDATTYEEAYDFAALSIEMALSRGGDQAVIKDRFNFTFFGGRSKESEYRSKVRSRVTANSLMELIGQSSQVFIMGHKNADLDALGAAMGINCMCRKKGKKARIVLDLEHNSVHKMLEEVLQVPEYQEVFISGQDALLECDNRSILIVVDTNRPDQVQCKPLLEAISKVCVVDHHRRAADYINPVVVNLHETFASSAAELTTELLLYSVDTTDVLPIEAKSLMAGICLDTKFFNVRTGERTFEAAALLRRMGADPTEVKKLLQNDFEQTMEKYEIIKSARIYRQEIALAPVEKTVTRALAAKAADEMLNISGITGSFVLYPDDGQVYISARSIGSADVQMILEPLGGGGNAATAGAQVRSSSVQDVYDRLIVSIDQYYEK